MTRASRPFACDSPTDELSRTICGSTRFSTSTFAVSVSTFFAEASSSSHNCLFLHFLRNVLHGGSWTLFRTHLAGPVFSTMLVVRQLLLEVSFSFLCTGKAPTPPLSLSVMTNNGFASLSLPFRNMLSILKTSTHRSDFMFLCAMCIFLA